MDFAGVSTDLVQKILDPKVLDNEANNFASVNNLLRNVAPTTGAWVGESGGAYNSGHHLVTDAFVFSFWYVRNVRDQLVVMATCIRKMTCVYLSFVAVIWKVGKFPNYPHK